MVSRFLQMQMDYIFFSYGLGFVLLAVGTYALSHSERHLMPWKWLALFGLFHGINEWLDMLVFSLKDSPDFYVVRLIVMTVSFLFLVEFGRAGFKPIDGKRPGRWIFIPLLSLAGLGAFAGMPGLNASVRYALGLTGGLWTALALWQHRHALPPGSRPLLTAALSMGLYGVATGMVVPQAPFFPAAVLNHASFLAFTGFPVQLLRGTLACTAAAAAWQYNLAWRKTVLKGVLSQAASRHEGWMIAGVIATLVAGWIMTCTFGDFGRQHDEEQYSHELELAQKTFEASVEKANNLVRTMAASPNLKSMGLQNGNPVVINATLDRYATVLSDSICYVLDTQGTTVASSNRGTPQSFVGHSYALRPYFKRGMEGLQGFYVAVGLTSMTPGYFSSFPVKDAAGDIVGVAVIKLNLDRLFIAPLHENYGFLADPNGVILSSTHPEFYLSTLQPISEDVRRELTQSKRYPVLREAPVLPVRFDPGTFFVFRGESLQSFEQKTSVEGLSLVILGPMKSLKMMRLVSILITLPVTLLFLVFFVKHQENTESSARIAASERLYRTLVEGSPNWVGLFDHEERCMAVNGNGLTAMGRTELEVHGLRFSEMWSKEADPMLEDSVKRVLSGEQVSFEMDQQKPDGTSITWRTVLNPICEQDGTVRSFVVIANDITAAKLSELERIQLEHRLRQAMKAESLGRMAASIAHHFNNMLCAVIGNLELALDDLPHESWARTSILESMKASRRAVEISQLMLMYLGQTTGQKEPLDLTEVIREALPLAGVTIPPTVHLKCELPALGLRILGERPHIKQILTNLLSNALEAMHEKGGELTVGVRVVEAPEVQGLQYLPLEWEPKAKDYACLFVADTGSGMDDATREKIFDPFFSTKFTGRGLGLSVVLGLVGAHDGAIAMESRPGRGSVFQVFFPIQPE